MLVVSVSVAGLLVTAAVSGLFYCICFASGLRVALYQSGVCSLLAFFYSAQKVELHKKLSVLQRFECSIHPGDGITPYNGYIKSPAERGLVCLMST